MVPRGPGIGPRPALAAEPQLFAVGDAARDARADAASIQLELALGAAPGFLQADVDIDRVVLAAERDVPRVRRGRRARSNRAAAGSAARRGACRGCRRPRAFPCP